MLRLQVWLAGGKFPCRKENSADCAAEEEHTNEGQVERRTVCVIPLLRKVYNTSDLAVQV